MSSSVTSNPQKIWLDRLKKDLGIFSPDAIKMIKAYLSKTGLKTKLISILVQMHGETMDSYNEDLKRKYNTIRSEFIKYIDERIVEMISPKECSWIDPWLMLSQVSGDQELLESSLHIHDILFTAQVVIGHQLLKGKDLAVEELHELKDILVESYLKLLKRAAHHESAQKILDELQDTLPKKLVELETSLREEDFEKAKILLQQAEDEMRVSSKALSVLSER